MQELFKQIAYPGNDTLTAYDLEKFLLNYYNKEQAKSGLPTDVKLLINLYSNEISSDSIGNPTRISLWDFKDYFAQWVNKLINFRTIYIC